MRSTTFDTSTASAFVAHPTSPRKDLAWSGWDAEGPWGLEILNLDSLWRQASWPALLGGLLAYPFDPVYAVATVLERPTAAIARWDELLRLRNVAGLAGVDAHGRLFQQDEFLPDFSSYESLFRVLRTYVVLDSSLSGEVARDTTAVRDALARGRSYMAVEATRAGRGVFLPRRPWRPDVADGRHRPPSA